MDRQDPFHPRCEVFKGMFFRTPVERSVCRRCKGNKLLCGKARCPIAAQVSAHAGVERWLRREMDAPSPPGFFVGSRGWPRVRLGPLGVAAPHEDPAFLDDPARWYGASIEEVVGFRSLLVRTMDEADVRSARDPPPSLRDCQALVLSSRPVDVELRLREVPRFSIAFSSIAQPMGPSAELERFAVVGTPSVPRAADRVTGDADLAADEGAAALYRAGVDVYHLQRILSAGLLGRAHERRLVPTRWAITATDDIVSRSLAERLRQLPELDEVLLFSNEYIGNRYEVILSPGPLEFEHLEAWRGGGMGPEVGADVVREHEPPEGRTRYAERQGGGYYAARLAAYEALSRMGRQAAVVALREIEPSYYLPVGVWEVRENLRRAMASAPERFQDVQGAVAAAASRMHTPLARWLSASGVLKRHLYQRTLAQFLGDVASAPAMPAAAPAPAPARQRTLLDFA